MMKWWTDWANEEKETSNAWTLYRLRTSEEAKSKLKSSKPTNPTTLWNAIAALILQGTHWSLIQLYIVSAAQMNLRLSTRHSDSVSPKHHQQSKKRHIHCPLCPKHPRFPCGYTLPPFYVIIFSILFFIQC